VKSCQGVRYERRCKRSRKRNLTSSLVYGYLLILFRLPNAQTNMPSDHDIERHQLTS